MGFLFWLMLQVLQSILDQRQCFWAVMRKIIIEKKCGGINQFISQLIGSRERMLLIFPLLVCHNPLPIGWNYHIHSECSPFLMLSGNSLPQRFSLSNFLLLNNTINILKNTVNIEGPPYPYSKQHFLFLTSQIDVQQKVVSKLYMYVFICVYICTFLCIYMNFMLTLFYFSINSFSSLNRKIRHSSTASS